MTTQLPSREDAFGLLKQYTADESLVGHALAVEAVMLHMARKHGEETDKWGLVGLVHDLDYHRFPANHCEKTEQILKENDWPEELVRAAISHGYGVCNDVEPVTLLEKTLFAVDELCGFVTACALVRPSKSVLDMQVKSVKKKWKQKSFAAGVNREVIEQGCGMLGVELTDLVADVIAGLREAEQNSAWHPAMGKN